MAFERFTKTRSKISTPKASIWSRGQIGFNQWAVQEYNLDKYGYVVLYYDKDTNRVGFEFTNDKKAEGASKLIIRKGAGASISAHAFLKTYTVDYSETKQYDLVHDRESELYVIDLKEKMQRAGK